MKFKSMSKAEVLAAVEAWYEGRVEDDTIACTEVEVESGHDVEAMFPGLSEREALAGWKVLVITTL